MATDVVVTEGDAASFHGRPLPGDDRPHVWRFRPSRSAVVLGSTQDEAVVDVDECARRDLDVVKRRSGGGIVLVGTDLTLWIDVLVPRRHALWDDDIGRASWWVGDVWAEALADAVPGVPSAVHRGAMEASEISRLVCFAGRGPGEVFVTGADGVVSKAVGISQRRTRDWARFQCALSCRWDGPLHRAVIRSSEADRFAPDAFERLGTDLDLDAESFGDDVVERFVDRLDG